MLDQSALVVLVRTETCPEHAAYPPPPVQARRGGEVGDDVLDVPLPAQGAVAPLPTTTTSSPARTSLHKHQAILDAAETIFLRDGYLGASMDEVAARSRVSKQTVYKHFGGKEALFVEIVRSMTSLAADAVDVNMSAEATGDDVRPYLRAYALTQLTVVLTPRLMQLRRLVVGEVARFPELARALYESGPKRAMSQLAAILEQLAERRLLTLDDPALAASHFNWLVMAEPVNRATLLGDDSIPAGQSCLDMPSRAWWCSWPRTVPTDPCVANRTLRSGATLVLCRSGDPIVTSALRPGAAIRLHSLRTMRSSRSRS